MVMNLILRLLHIIALTTWLMVNPRGHQLPKKGVRISKSLEFTLISRDFIDFMGFYQQKPDHNLIITRLYINKTTTTYLYCIL